MIVVDEIGIVYPQVAMPGALAIVAAARNVERLRTLQGAGPSLYMLRAVVGTHIPLTGTVQEIVALSPETGLSVNEPPLSSTFTELEATRSSWIS